ncbi:MAG: alpha/beta hydrolase [Hyphomicrobiales bacterium]|nr:alpha/beta hydrolase [Hyphomicrobiales bacterium]
MAADFTIEDVTYHSPGGMTLLARLYRPVTPGPHPAVIDVHGGRWCSETRLTNACIDEAVAASGVVVMALDFRMPPLVQYPVPVADINLAIRWLRAHAAEYEIRPDWIGGIGTSSGGHQLALNGLNPDAPAYRQDHPAEMSGVSADLAFMVLCWPVSDPPARYAYAIERKMDIHVQSHNAYWPDEATMSLGSPQRIVTEGEAATLPPTLLIQGDADVILAPGMSDRFAAAFRTAGGDLEFHTFPGEAHTFITKNPSSAASRDALEHIVTFIHRRTDAA